MISFWIPFGFSHLKFVDVEQPRTFCSKLWNFEMNFLLFLKVFSDWVNFSTKGFFSKESLVKIFPKIFNFLLERAVLKRPSKFFREKTYKIISLKTWTLENLLKETLVWQKAIFKPKPCLDDLALTCSFSIASFWFWFFENRKFPMFCLSSLFLRKQPVKGSLSTNNHFLWS